MGLGLQHDDSGSRARTYDKRIDRGWNVSSALLWSGLLEVEVVLPGDYGSAA